MNSGSPALKPKVAIRLFQPPAARAGERRKILLLKLDHIGDFITGIAAFRIIREAFADAEITLICLPGTVALAQSTGLFDKVAGAAILQDSDQVGKAPRMYDEDRIARFKSLLDGPYFFAADFKHDSDERFWLDHVDTGCRAAFAAQTQKGIDIVIPAMEWDVPTGAIGGGSNLPIHAEVRLALLAHAIVETLCDRPSLASLVRPAAHALSSERRMKIGVSLGAGSELRKWDNEYWTALLSRLIQTRDAVIVFFGGEMDKEETKALIAKLPAGRCVDLTAAMPLAEVPSYLMLLDAYIGCDTGLTHLAANLGIGTVNIFAGVSNVSVWRARGAKAKTIYAEVFCAPCHLRFKKDCPNGNICMRALVPEAVYACFEQVLADHWAAQKTASAGA